MDKKMILETLINHYAGGNKTRFASMIGVTPQLISNWLGVLQQIKSTPIEVL